jgi:DMSO/TMAO reductase YedYZ molybdopterin-dependent catalytic subunit
MTYEDLLAMPARHKNATLDCTLGWYTIQSWSGISLDELLKSAGVDPSAEWVGLRSVTGYEHPLPMFEARDVLLATHVGGEPLTFVHGAPLRAVVPSRRGWFWVKWLTRIEVG